MDNSSGGIQIEGDGTKPVTNTGASSGDAGNVSISKIYTSGGNTFEATARGNVIDLKIKTPAIKSKSTESTESTETTTSPTNDGVVQPPKDTPPPNSEKQEEAAPAENNPPANTEDQTNNPAQKQGDEQQPNEGQPVNPGEQPATGVEKKPEPTPEETAKKNDATKKLGADNKTVKNPDGSTSASANFKDGTKTMRERKEDPQRNEQNYSTRKAGSSAGQPPPNEQQQAAAMNSQKAADRKEKKPGIKDRLKNAGNNIRNAPKNTANKIRQAPANAKNAIKNAPGNIASRMQSERARLRKKVTELEKQKARLNGDIDQTKMSTAMRMIKFFFPGLYARIMSVTNIGKKLSTMAKIKAYEAQILRYKSLITILNAQIGFANTVSAVQITLQIIALGFGTIVLGILFSLLSPLILLAAFIFFTILGGPLSKALVEIKKQFTEQLANITKKLESAKKELSIDKEINNTYRAMASASSMPMTANPPPEEAPAEGQPGAEQGAGAATEGEPAQPGTSPEAPSGPGPYQNTEPAKPEEPAAPEEQQVAA